MPHPYRGKSYGLLNRLNRVFCRIMYAVTPLSPAPLPETGPVLLVSDHTSFSDPMVLAATANRPIIFLTAQEVYTRRSLRWLCRTLLCIPVSRGSSDVGAVRALLRTLGRGEVVGIFPEGGIDEHRAEKGHLGVGYLALKTGAAVVPAAITWAQVRPLSLLRSLMTPGQAIVRYGTPIVSECNPNPDRKTIDAVTADIMRAIRDLRRSQR